MPLAAATTDGKVVAPREIVTVEPGSAVPVSVCAATFVTRSPAVPESLLMALVIVGDVGAEVSILTVYDLVASTFPKVSVA